MGLRGNLQSFLRARDSDRGSSECGNRRKSRRQTTRWELFLKRSSKKVMGGEFYRQGSPGTTGWKMVQKSYGEKCLSGLWSLTIILGREKFFEIIGNAYQKYLPLISHFLCSTDLCLVAQMVKNPPAVQETWVQSLSWEDPLEEGNGYLLQFSGLENSKECIVHGVPKSWTWLSDFYFFTLKNTFPSALSVP